MAWDLDRLIRLTTHFPRGHVPLIEIRECAAIVIVAMTLCACGKSQREVPESFAISLVQTQPTGLLSAAGTGRLLSMHPSSVASSSSTNYWVENTELLSAADLLSAEVHVREPVKLTRSQFEQGIKQYGGNIPGVTNLTYADYLKDQAQPHPEVVLTFTDAGKIRFGEATRRHLGRQLAIIVDGQIITAPLVREEITGGVAVVAGTFTVHEAHVIVDKIYGRK